RQAPCQAASGLPRCPKSQAEHYCGSNEQQAEISRQGGKDSRNWRNSRARFFFLSARIRRPVRNDVLIDPYAFDRAEIFPDALYETSHELSHSSNLIPVVAPP